MVNRVVASLVIAGLIAAIAAGGVSALSGSGPVQAPRGEQAAGAAQGPALAADTAMAEPDSQSEQPVTQQTNGEEAAGAQHIAGVIADEFGTSAEEVMALHEQGIGFGALFKLYSLARAKGVSVNDLLATLPQGEDGPQFAFGKMFKELAEEEAAVLEEGPKNLGRLVSASHRPEGAGEATAAEAPGRGHGRQKKQ